MGGAQSTDIKLVKRGDGQMQVTYKGHPLYFYAGDQSAGQMNGQGINAFGAEWYVLSPAGSKVEGKASSSSSGGGSSSSSATITIGDPGSSPPPGSPGEPPVPTAGQTVGIIGVAGTILVDGVPAVGPIVVKFGQTIDATNGILKLASFGPNGELQTVVLFGGVFKVLQGTDGVTVFALQSGDFAGLCGGAKRAVSAVSAKPPKAKPKAKPTAKKKIIANKTVVRSLWGQGQGAFRTQGRYASATVRGTLWLTADRCDGTLTDVRQGIVDVVDLATQKHYSVAAGHSFLVRPS
jgi:hypothetical protein